MTGPCQSAYESSTSEQKTSGNIEPIEGLDKNLPRYEDHRGKAKMLIFNHSKFDDTELNVREGTKFDVDKLKVLFTKFGFDVDVQEDRTKDNIFKDLKEVTEKELKCIAIVVLSHGDEGKIWAQDKKYDEKDILNFFNKNESFKGVPKLFIFQICRKKTLINLSLPDEDMIVLHSTYFDQLANRDINKGTWFIQTLCERLDLMETENLLLDEMTFVMRDVCNRYDGDQMPMIMYNTKKHFYLNPETENRQQ